MMQGTVDRARPLGLRIELRAWHLIVALGVLGAACELVWQLRFGLASPCRALVFVLIAICIGNPLRQLTLGAGRARGFTACFGAGFVGMGMLYLVMRGLHASHTLIVACWLVLASMGAVRGRWRGMMSRRLGALDVLIGVLVTLFCARAEWLSELPQLTSAHPTVFAGIDTPLWLNLAYGLERAVPPRELLFHGEVLNYHFGAGLLPLLMRETTGLPMHVAHTVSVALCGIAAALLLAQVSQRLFTADRGARRVLGWAMPLLGCVWFQLWVYNLPSAAGNFLLSYGLLELVRAPRWRSLWLTLPTFLLLMLTKEVAYVALLLCAGCIGCWALYQRRDWTALARLMLTFAVTRLLYEPLVHRDQKVTPVLYREHLDLHWIWGELSQMSVVHQLRTPAPWMLAAGVVAAALLLWRRHVRDAATLIGACSSSTVLVCLALLVRPEFSPPLDPLHAEWALKDMAQFSRLGGHLTLLCLSAALMVTASRWMPRVFATQPLVLALAAALAWFTEDRFFRVPPPSPDQQYEEYRGDSPIVPVLAQIPVRRSLIASDHLNWNGENPHWAAFFGHRFYCLRRVRWAPAYARFGDVTSKQDALFRASDIQEAAALARGEHITHVIVDKRRPTPWSAQARPQIETDRHAVYTF